MRINPWRSVATSLFLALSLTGLVHADKKSEAFRPAPIDDYPSKQAVQGVTAAVHAYTEQEEIKAVFGKLDPYKYGILPVLFLIRNDGKAAISMENIRFQFVPARGRPLENTPAEEVAYTQGVKRPKINPSPIPGIGGGARKIKNPLQNDVITERAFAARMLPPGDTAWGFVYFQTGYSSGASLQVSGLREAGTGKELFFFELPFAKP